MLLVFGLSTISTTPLALITTRVLVLSYRYGLALVTVVDSLLLIVLTALLWLRMVYEVGRSLRAKDLLTAFSQ